MDYYLNQHIPLVRLKMGAAIKGMSVAQGLIGAQPGTEAAYRVIFSMLFDSAEAFAGAFGPAAAEIQGDIPRYTNLAPIIQVSEVKM